MDKRATAQTLRVQLELRRRREPWLANFDRPGLSGIPNRFVRITSEQAEPVDSHARTFV
jgi:hypothetical protein